MVGLAELAGGTRRSLFSHRYCLDTFPQIEPANQLSKTKSEFQSGPTGNSDSVSGAAIMEGTFR